MQAIGYIRVSTEAQATEGVSLAAQRARVRAWATIRGTKLVAIHAAEGTGGVRVLSQADIRLAGCPSNTLIPLVHLR